MAAQTTPTSDSTDSAPTLLMAMDLSQSRWHLRFSRLHRPSVYDTSVAARDLEALRRAISRYRDKLDLDPRCRFVTCYEAGRDGFWLARFFQSEGVVVRVIEPASIEVNRRKRRAKSDGIDTATLHQKLSLREQGTQTWREVRIPTDAHEDRRRPDRERDRLISERTRHTNRIGSALATQGIVLDTLRDLPSQLEAVRRWDDSPLPMHLREELERTWQRIEVIEHQIGELEEQRRQRLRADLLTGDRAAWMIVSLMGLCGIGEQGSSRLVRELFGWRPYRNRRQAAGLVGLTPTPWASGDMAHELGISKAGNGRLRALLVELSWLWLRYQPDSKQSRWFWRRFGNGGKRMRRRGIVALSRRLLVELWRYADQGIVPEGARFKSQVVI